jgi:ATP/ADP translocase
MAASETDRQKILLPALALGMTTMAFIVAKTGRDALFFQGKGIFQLPVATLMITAASLPLAMLFVKAMKTWGARPARIGLMLFAAAVLAAAAPFLEPGDSMLLFNVFIFIPAVFAIIFASLWLLASDIFEVAPKPQAARNFSKIGASSLAGGMIGGFAAKGLGHWVEPKWLIFVAAVTVMVVVGLVVYIHQRFPTNITPRKDQGEKQAGYLASFRNPYALTLLFISMTGALAGLLIDVQFYISATMATMGSKGNANFFANFYIMLNFGSLLLQLFATPKIQDKIGIRGGLMVLPFALVGGASFAGAAATAFSLSVLRVTEGGLRSSVHRSIWEQAFVAVDSRERSLVKLAVDGIGARVAEGLAAGALYFWVQQVAPGGVMSGPLDTRWMAWLTLATVIVWLGVTQRLSRTTPEQAPTKAVPAAEMDCERFPDQCPCTTELGKGIA